MPKAKPAALAAANKDLPQHWEARDVKGRIVYINHTTRTTQWTKPKVSRKKGAAAPDPVVRAPNKSAPARANGGAAAGAAGGGSRAGPAVATPARPKRPSASNSTSNSTPGSNLPASAGVASRALTTVSSPLPAGWESKIIDGRVVYIDHANQRTSFERPLGQAGELSQKTRPHSSRRQMSIATGGELVPLSNGTENLGSSRGSHRSGHPSDPIYASNASSAVGDSPLPPGWGRSVTPNGELYYVNHVSKTTTWSRPQWTTGSDGEDESVRGDGTRNPETSLASIKSGKSTRSRRGDMLGKFAESAEPPLPPGWEERMSAEGKVFYMNHNDKTTHWTRPDPPPVQPDDSPDDDVPPVATEDVEMASRSVSPAIPTPPAEHPSDGGPAVSSLAPVGDPAATASSALTLDSPARQGGVAVAAAAAAAATAAAAAAADDHDDHDDGLLTSAAKESLPKATVGTTDVGAAAAATTAVVLEEVAGSSPARGGYGGADANPKRAPSATVVAAVAAADEEATRSVGAPPPAAAAVRKEEPEGFSGEAAEPTADDDAAREGEEGGAGAVSSVVKSGLFGATITRPGGSSSGNSSKMAAALGRSASSVVPLYASNAGVPGVAAAAAAAAEKPKPELEEPEVDSLPEGWIELKTAAGKTYYQNSISKTTQWSRPASTKAVAALKTATYNSTSSPAVGGAAAEAGWEKVMTEDGRPYFQNTVTKTTSWQQPEGWVEPGAAAASTEAETTVASHGSFFKSGGGGSAATMVKGLGVEAPAETDAVAVAPTPIGRLGGPVASSARETPVPKAEAQEAPLPPGWEKLYTEDGVPFWTNHNERTTSWDPPVPPAAEAATAAAAAAAATPTVVGVVSEAKGMRQESLGGESGVFESVDDVGGAAEAVAIGVPVEGTQQVSRNLGADGRPLPEGWEMQTTDQGIPYYVDHLNKRTSWDPPMMSSGGMSVIASELPDIPPAELVPDSADLYMGADLLNRFFGSWMGDAQGKSPLEAARNVIVTYLTGPGLKVTKGRNSPNLQRYLYLSPTNKQVVWATKATSKGKLSKKGLTLDGITELHSEEDGIRVEARGESSPLFLKSAAVDTLTSEGATILLGVLLADMTGTMLRLQGVSGGDGSCYYPASFVEDVLAVRRARMEKNAALAAAATTPRQATATIPNQSSSGSIGGGPTAAKHPAEATKSAVQAQRPVAKAVAMFSSSQQQQQQQDKDRAASSSNGSRAVAAVAASTPSKERVTARAAPAANASSETSSAPPKGSSVAPKDPPAAAAAGSAAKPVSVASEWRAAERAVSAAGGGGGGGKSPRSGVAASYMAHLSKGSQKTLRHANSSSNNAAASTTNSSATPSAASLTYSDSGESDEEKDAGRAAATAAATAAAATAAATTAAATTASAAAAAAAAAAGDGGRAPPPRSSSSSSGFVVEPSRAASSYPVKPEIATSIAMSGEDEDTDCPLPKEDVVPAALAKEDEGAVAAAAAAAAASAAGASAAASAAIDAEVEAKADAVVPETAPAVVETEKASQPVVDKQEEPAAEEEEEEEDEETREYRSVLTEMLRPVKMEKYVESFLASEITLDILPLVERGDLQTEVGITGAVPQLKIMKAIKTRFPDGV